MSRLSEFLNNLSPTKQYLLVRTYFDSAIYVFDAYCMTYVFKENGRVQDVVVNILITLVTFFVFFLLGSIFMNRVGVENNLRTSFLLYVFTGLFGIYLVHIGAMSFVLISLARGAAEGFYWASSHTIELSGLPHDSRSKLYSISYAINGVFTVVAPVTLGYLLAKSNSLLPAFVVFTAICLLAVITPYQFNINKKLSLHRNSFTEILKNPKLGSFVAVKLTISAYWMIDWLVLSIIPFVVLGNELNMGIYLTISSLFGVVISFATHKLTVQQKAKLGGPLLVIMVLADIILALYFNPYMLYINAILTALIFSVVAPLENDMSARITNHLDPAAKIPVELNIFMEFVYTIARMLIGGLVLGIIATGISVILVLKILVILLALFEIGNYLLSVKFLKYGRNAVINSATVN